MDKLPRQPRAVPRWDHLADSQDFNDLFLSAPVQSKIDVMRGDLLSASGTTDPHKLGYQRGWLDAIEYLAGLPELVLKQERRRLEAGGASGHHLSVQ